MPNLQQWLEDNSKWLGGAAALLAIVVALAGTITWATKLQDDVNTLKAQMLLVLASPPSSVSKKGEPSGGIGVAAAPTQSACENLSGRFADAARDVDLHAEDSIKTLMDSLGCFKSGQ